MNEFVTKLSNLEFFQGDTIVIPFEFYDGKNNPIDLRYVKIEWKLCPFGQYETPVLILSNENTAPNGEKEIVVREVEPYNICYVNIPSEYTENLTDIKYTQQPSLVLERDGYTEYYIRAEGDILLKPMIRREI